MREGYHFTGADVSSLEFAIEAPVQSSEEDEENGFQPGSINYMLDKIRENQTRSPLTPLPKTPGRNQPQSPLFQAPLSPISPLPKTPGRNQPQSPVSSQPLPPQQQPARQQHMYTPLAQRRQRRAKRPRIQYTPSDY